MAEYLAPTTQPHEAVHTLTGTSRTRAYALKLRFVPAHARFQVRGHDASASRQHVPLADFVRNMEHMVNMLMDNGSRVLVMTPPPILDSKRVAFEGADKNKEVLWSSSTLWPYVEACREVATRCKLPIVDVYEGFTRGNLSSLLVYDGMHPSANGGELMANLVIEAIAKHYPELRPAELSNWREMTPLERLPFDFPDHKAIDASDADSVADSIGRHRSAIDCAPGITRNALSMNSLDALEDSLYDHQIHLPRSLTLSRSSSLGDFASAMAEQSPHADKSLVARRRSPGATGSPQSSHSSDGVSATARGRLSPRAEEDDELIMF